MHQFSTLESRWYSKGNNNINDNNRKKLIFFLFQIQNQSTFLMSVRHIEKIILMDQIVTATIEKIVLSISQQCSSSWLHRDQSKIKLVFGFERCLLVCWHLKQRWWTKRSTDSEQSQRWLFTFMILSIENFDAATYIQSLPIDR